MKRPLKGHSGCELILKGSIVRKVSSNPEYNIRLVNQANKQALYKHDAICTPAVLDIGEKNGLAYFDMEYIRGVSFADYCNMGDIKTISAMIKKLISFGNCGLASDPSKKADFKDNIIVKCKSLSDFPIEIVDSVDWQLPIGSCHGDLTFENILVTEGQQLYVIDFLDSYVESSEIDCSKLMQDTFCSWSYRNKPLVPWHVLRYLNDALSSRRRYILLLINLHRILPYTTDGATKIWLENQIKRTMLKII